MTSDRFDRRLNVLLVVCGLVLLAVVLFAIFAVPAIFSTDSSTGAIQRGNDLASCRAQFSSAVTEAQTDLFIDKAALDVLTNRGLRAAVNRDEAELQRVLTDSPPLEQKVIDDGAMVRARTAEFRAAVSHAQSDPSGFVQECNNGGK